MVSDIAILRMQSCDGIPEALDAACRASGARILYTMPTIHNPTTVLMPAERRAALALRTAQLGPEHRDTAGTHHRHRILVLGEGQQQMFERGVLVAALGGQGQSPVQRLFEVT